MPIPRLPLEGACRCGQVRLKISAQPLFTAACHCRGCQKMSASAYSCTAAIPSAAFEVIQGEPVIGGAHGPDVHHYHCPHCKTWMFTRPVGMDFVNVRPTMLDDSTWFFPFMETFASAKFPWAETGAIHSFQEFPPMESFGSLLKEFAASS